MNKLKYLLFVGLFSFLISCEKDGIQVVMLANPVAPTLKTTPDLTLKRAEGTKVLTFVGTPVDPGFRASANYFLEVCAAGTNFTDPVTIISGIQDTLLKITVSELNGILLKKFPADQTTSVDLRIRSVLVVDAGTGAPGTSTKPFVYSSASKNVSITTYGLPRLDLINSGLAQKIESALGDGIYTGLVKLDAAKAFTLKDPDSNVSYGAGGTGLAVNGTAISATLSGWHKLTANTKTLTYTLDQYMIGVVGSATPNGWGAPDLKMDYDAKAGVWKITTTLIDGEIKFRLNDSWNWNLGGTPAKLEHNGANLAVTAGNYTITLTITNATQGSEAGTCTIVKN